MTRNSTLRISSTLCVALVLGCSAFGAACSKTNPEPEKTSEGPAPVPAPVHSSVAPSGSGAAAAAAGTEEITWAAPAAWVTMPNPNPMRKATFKVPKAAGDAEDAELTVSAASGGVDANVKRWSSQFGNAEAKTEARSPNGLKVTMVELKGTFASTPGMMGGPTTPKEHWMLLGAVVDSGERQHFFKMTGPEKTVSAAKKDFDAFVASFHGR